MSRVAEELPWADEDGELEPLEHGGPRGLAFSFLALVPLFVAYELSLPAIGERATAERAGTYLLRIFGDHEAALRWGALGAFAAWAGWRVAAAEFERGRAALLMLLEAAAFALLLGPFLLFVLRWSPVDLGALTLDAGVPRPSLEGVAHVVGSAAWEEVLVRLGLFSLVFLVVIRLFSFFGAPRRLAEFVSDTVALIVSSLGFAALHLDEVARWVGTTGEPFDRHVFLWRTLAGLALAALYRWRGLGVATWTHALYNLGFAIGASPAVFLV
ncbi:MAG: CPBP family glutamic-type intramembrane protease [Planctomycetota bacterium]